MIHEIKVRDAKLVESSQLIQKIEPLEKKVKTFESMIEEKESQENEEAQDFSHRRVYTHDSVV
jgi:hypothetical protein